MMIPGDVGRRKCFALCCTFAQDAHARVRQDKSKREV